MILKKIRKMKWKKIQNYNEKQKFTKKNRRIWKIAPESPFLKTIVEHHFQIFQTVADLLQKIEEFEDEIFIQLKEIDEMDFSEKDEKDQRML